MTDVTISGGQTLPHDQNVVFWYSRVITNNNDIEASITIYEIIKQASTLMIY